MSTPTARKAPEKRPRTASQANVAARPTDDAGSAFGLAGALLRVHPREIDGAAIGQLLGNQCVSGLDGVAMAVGVDVGTVEQWATQGMPTPTGKSEPAPAPPNPFYPPNARCCKLLRRLRIENFYLLDVLQLIGGELLAPTIADVARAFGVHPDTIKSWLAQGAPKPAKKKPYNLFQILCWRVRTDTLGLERK